MKVLAINASPARGNGNTAEILNPFLAGMEEAGADVTIRYTENLVIKPCKGCYTCWLRTPGRCIHDDDMKWLLPEITGTEILVIASPVYGWGITGPMKTLLDRTIPRALPFIEIKDEHMQHPPRKGVKKNKIVLVSTCGLWEPDNFDPLIHFMQARCRYGNATFAGALTRPEGPALKRLPPGHPRKLEILAACRDAGRHLAATGSIEPDLLEIVRRPIMSRDVYLETVNKALLKMMQGWEA